MSDTAKTVKSFNPAVTIERVAYFDERFYRIKYLDGETRNFTSVTEYLQAAPKPHLAIWRGNVGNEEADRIANQAMSRGSRIHHACYVWLNFGMVILNPPVEKELITLNEKAAILRRQAMLEGRRVYELREQDEYLAVQRFTQLMRTLYPGGGIPAIGAEVTMFSEELDAAGTCDYILPLDGGTYMINGATPLNLPTGVYIGDLKTGRESEQHWMQIAAYCAMYKERVKQEPTGGLLFYLEASTKGGIAGVSTKMKPFDQLMKDDLTDFRAAQRMYRREHPRIEAKEFEMPMALMRTEGGIEIARNFVLGMGEKLQSLEIVAPVAQVKPKEEKPTAGKGRGGKNSPAKAGGQQQALPLPPEVADRYKQP